MCVVSSFQRVEPKLPTRRDAEDRLRRQRDRRFRLGDLPRRLHACCERIRRAPRAAHLGLSRCAASQFALLGRNALLAPPLLHPASWSRMARFVVDVATIVMPTIVAPLCSPDKALLFCGACLATAALRRGTLRQTPQLELAHLNEAHPVALTNLRALVMLQVCAPTCATTAAISTHSSSLLLPITDGVLHPRGRLSHLPAAVRKGERRHVAPRTRLAACHLGLAPPCVSRPTRGGTA